MLVGSILQQLKDAHDQDHGSKRVLNFGVYYKNTLVALCHALEDSILAHDYNPLMIAAFQQGKWYLQEADRYGDIAERSQQIVILAAPDGGFADHPTSQRSNVELVSLSPDDPVSQEWHLIIASPNYTAMVLCQELSDQDYGPDGPPEADLERKFYGLWTFEPSLVHETTELAIAHIRAYEPQLAERLAQQLADIKAGCQQADALCGMPTADNLGDIVTRVVDYLQTSQQNLPNQQVALSLLNPSNLDNNLLSNELQAFLRIAQLIDQTDLSNPMAASEVAALAETIGQLLDLPAWQLNRLRLAGLLHRIAFLQDLDAVLPAGSTNRYDEDANQPAACPLTPGTLMLRRMQRLKAIATILTHQTEWWNGTGRPGRLAGDEIPIESRILGLVAAFQGELAKCRQALSSTLEASDADLTQALNACKAQEGDRWDPKLVETLTLLVSGLKQGIDLPVALPKIAAGLWLLDSRSEEDLLRAYSEAIAESSS